MGAIGSEAEGCAGESILFVKSQSGVARSSVQNPAFEHVIDDAQPTGLTSLRISKVEPHGLLLVALKRARTCNLADRPQNSGMTAFFRQGRAIVAVILGMIGAGATAFPSGAAEV